jgi:hypothetical protein
VTYEALAERYQLGQLLKTYGWHKPTYRRLLGLWLFVLPFAFLASLMLLGLPALVISIAIIAVSTKRLNSSRPVIYLYENGLIDRRTASPRALRYDDMHSLWFRKTLEVTKLVSVLREEYKIQTSHGKIYQFKENIDGISEIGTFIQQKIVTLQLPRAIAQIEAGEVLKFNTLSVSADGIHHRKKFLPWPELGKVDIKAEIDISDAKNGYRQWTWVTRDRTPNVMLFMALVQHFQSSPHRSTS